MTIPQEAVEAIIDDEQLARNIAHGQTHGAGGLYGDEWVDIELSSAAEKCALEGIQTGRRLERHAIASALGLDVEEIEALLVTDVLENLTESADQGAAARPAMRPGGKHG